ncbi:MAG: ribosome biogenesis GTP-binding protein YsxC [Synergistaceae bacterium]|jgi:GTP-binding protein|nr:ribosome biogenesis GTP-binding protein YsxC [Synergistaceae bacterium]
MPRQWIYEEAITAFLENQLPPFGLPEITVLGRSNVGKSSLINKLAARSIARSSATPGKTRSINFFRFRGKHAFYLVDLPGYGYSAVSQDTRRSWKRLIETYMARNSAILHLHLVDFRHGYLKTDEALRTWLACQEAPTVTVFTKADKIPKGKWKALLSNYCRGAECAFVTSAETGAGVDDLRHFLEDYVDRSLGGDGREEE